LSTQRLSPTERAAIEQQIKDLEQAQTRQSVPSTPGVFGMFDRPKPGTSDPEPARAEAGKSEPPAKSSLQPEAKSDLQEATPDLSPEEFESLAERITAIADHICRLRACWVTSLSTEIDRQAELFRSKLQELARTLPDELLEVILGDRTYLLRQPVRDVSKPTITEKVQLRTIAPSAPALDVVGTWTELYYAIHQPRPPRPPEHPPGYIPDGLQALVA